MMVEYIEKEAVRAVIEKSLRWCENNLLDSEYKKGCIAALKDDLGNVKHIPAANVVTVVHSKWKYYKKQGIAVCTNCSFERNLDDNFGRAVACPNCGARMDGDQS